MANRGYDAVAGAETNGDLGRTDLQEDLEFHSSDFNAADAAAKAPLNASGHYNGVQGPTPTSSKRFLWTLAFYSQFFDVDTSDVLNRCWAALYPRSSFLDVLDGNADLYGPFWIATTVVFILFITGTMSQYLAENHDIHFEYDFTLLTGAAGLIYGYTLFVPIGLWGILKWTGSEAATLIESWALYGYANVIWLPVALISWSPITALNYVFVACGLACSLIFLLRNLWPVVSAADAKISRLLLIAVVVLHSALAIAIKVLFFASVTSFLCSILTVSHGSPAHTGTSVPARAPVQTPAPDDLPDDSQRLLRALL